MACGGGCGCEACGDERRGRGVVLAVPFGTEASCGCDGGASATGPAGARRPPRHPALAGVTTEEPVGVGASARGGVRAGVVPPQALEQRPDPETLRFPVLPGTPESAPTPTPPAPGVTDALGTPPPVAPSQGVDVPAAPGLREPPGLAAPRMHLEEPTSQKRGKGGSGEPQARQPDDGELRVGDPAQLERPAPWDVVVMPPLGPWGSGPLLGGFAPRRRGPGAKIALGVAQRAPRPPEIHATLLPWGTLSTTPSMPTTASGEAKAAEPCPCTCACVPAEVAPASSTTKVNAPGALLPGGGAAGTGGAAPGAILVSHDDEPEAAARLASIGIAGAPQRLSPPPEGDVGGATSPGAGTTPPDPAASAQDAAEAAREAEALAHEAARETAAADTVEGKVRGSARAEAAAGAAKQAAKDARERAAGAPSDRKASADRAARDAGKAAARAEKAADAAKKDKLRAIVASGGGGKGKGLATDGTEEVLPVRTPPVSSPSDVARRPSPPPLSPPLHPTGGVGGSSRVAVPDGALPAVRGFGPGSGRTVALGVASPPREAAPFGAGGRIDGTAAPWVAPAPSAFGPGGALRRRERAAVAAAPPNSAPTVPLPDRVGWMLGEVGGGERDAGREFDRTPFGAEGSTQRPVGGLVSRTKDATTPSALAVAPPQVPDAPAGPVRTPAGAASPWGGTGAGMGSGAGAGVAAVAPPQAVPIVAGPPRGRSFAPAAVAPGTAALGPADGGVPVAAAGDVAPEVPSRPPRTPPGSGAQPGVALRSADLDVPDGTERGGGGASQVLQDAIDARIAADALGAYAERARLEARSAQQAVDDYATALALLEALGSREDLDEATRKAVADANRKHLASNSWTPELAEREEAGAAAAQAAAARAAASAASAASLAERIGGAATRDLVAKAAAQARAVTAQDVHDLEVRNDRRISSKAGNLRGEIGALEKARGREAAAHLARGAALDREDARQAELRTKAATSSLGPTERRDLARLERREDRRDAERERMLDREIDVAARLERKLSKLVKQLEEAGRTPEADPELAAALKKLADLRAAAQALRDARQKVRGRRARRKHRPMSPPPPKAPDPSAMPMAWVMVQADVASGGPVAIQDTFSASAYAQVLTPEGSALSPSAVLSAHGYDFDVGRGVLDASIGFASATVTAADVVAPPQLVSLVGGPCPPGCCSTACKPGEVCRCVATTDPVKPDGTDPSSKTGEPLTGPPTPPTPPTPGGGRGGGATGGAGGSGLTTQPPPGTVAPEHTYAPPVQPPPPPDDTTTLAPPGSCPPGSSLCDGSGTAAPPPPARGIDRHTGGPCRYSDEDREFLELDAPPMPAACREIEGAARDMAEMLRRDPVYRPRNGGVVELFRTAASNVATAAEAIRANTRAVRRRTAQLVQVKADLELALVDLERARRLHRECWGLQTGVRIRGLSEHIARLRACMRAGERDIVSATASVANARRMYEAFLNEAEVRNQQTLRERLYAELSAWEVAVRGALDFAMGASLFPLLASVLGTEVPTHLPDGSAANAGAWIAGGKTVADVAPRALEKLERMLKRLGGRPPAPGGAARITGPGSGGRSTLEHPTTSTSAATTHPPPTTGMTPPRPPAARRAGDGPPRPGGTEPPGLHTPPAARSPEGSPPPGSTAARHAADGEIVVGRSAGDDVGRARPEARGAPSKRPGGEKGPVKATGETKPPKLAPESEPYTEVFQTKQGPVEFSADVRAEGTTVHLERVSVFPTEAEKLSVGPKEVLRILREQIGPKFKAQGFKSMRISGTRITGAKVESGMTDTTVDFTLDLD